MLDVRPSKSEDRETGPESMTIRGMEIVDGDGPDTVDTPETNSPNPPTPKRPHPLKDVGQSPKHDHWRRRHNAQTTTRRRSKLESYDVRDKTDHLKSPAREQKRRISGKLKLPKDVSNDVPKTTTVRDGDCYKYHYGSGPSNSEPVDYAEYLYAKYDGVVSDALHDVSNRLYEARFGSKTHQFYMMVFEALKRRQRGVRFGDRRPKPWST